MTLSELEIWMRNWIPNHFFYDTGSQYKDFIYKRSEKYLIRGIRAGMK